MGWSPTDVSKPHFVSGLIITWAHIFAVTLIRSLESAEGYGCASTILFNPNPSACPHCEPMQISHLSCTYSSMQHVDHTPLR